MKVTFRLPSRGTQYGYVEVSGESEEFGLAKQPSAEALGSAYAEYVRNFQAGEKGVVASRTPAKAAQKPPTPVLAPQGQAAPSRPSESRAELSMDEMNLLLRDELGARVVAEVKTDSGAPWEANVKPTPKPWNVTGSLFD